MAKDYTLRDILLRIESRLDGHDKRFEEQKEQINTLTELTVTSLNSIDQRFEEQKEQIDTLTEFTVTSLNSIDQRFEDQKEQLDTLTEFTVTSLNSIDGELKTLNHRVLKLELSFEDFRSDSRAYWEQLSDTRTRSIEHQEQLENHEVRLTKLEAG